MNRKHKVALYVRVSTADQTTAHQKTELLAYAKARKWTPTIFADTASGKAESRVAFDAMMERVRKGEFKAVCAVKLDRMGRSLAHMVKLIGELSRLKVALVIPGQGIDSSDDNPAGRLTLHILSAIAEFERSLIVERTLAGLKTAREAGRMGGRPSLMEERKTLAEAILARTPGLSVRVLAEEVGCSLGTAHALKRAVLAA